MFNISRNIKYFHFLSGQILHKLISLQSLPSYTVLIKINTMSDIFWDGERISYTFLKS